MGNVAVWQALSSRIASDRGFTAGFVCSQKCILIGTTYRSIVSIIVDREGRVVTGVCLFPYHL